MDFSETSKVVTLYTRDLGKVAAMAKGARRLKSGFEVALDLLSVCGICVLRKPQAELDLLTEAVLEERFPGLRANLAGLYAAYYIAEILDGLTQVGDAHPPLFEETLTALRALSAGSERAKTVCRYRLRLLTELGYGPNLESCAACGGAVPMASKMNYRVELGGLICPSCRKERPASSITGETVEVLRRLALADPGPVERIALSATARRELIGLTAALIEYQLGRRPKTASLLTW